MNKFLNEALKAKTKSDINIELIKEAIILMIDNEMSKDAPCIPDSNCDIIDSYTVGLCDEYDSALLDELYCRLNIDLESIYYEVIEAYDFTRY